MDVGRPGGAVPAEVHPGHAAVRKGDAVAGIDALLHLGGKAVDLHKVLQIGGQLLLRRGGNAVHPQHRAAHVHVDHQLVGLQLLLVGLHIGPAALQADLLAAVPHELQGALGGILREIAQHLHVDDAARAVVVHALGKVHRVVVGAKGDDLLGLLGAQHRGDHVVGGPLLSAALQHQAGLAGALAHHVDGVQHPGVHHGHVAKGPQGAAQLPGGEVGLLPLVPQLALHGDDARHPGLHQLPKQGHPHVAVHQHNLTPGVAQAHVVSVLHIEEGGLQPLFRGVLGALIARDGDLLLEGLQDLQRCLLHNALLNLKGLDDGGHAQFIALFLQDLGGLLLFGRTGNAGEADLFQQLHFPLPTNFHGRFPPSFCPIEKAQRCSRRRAFALLVISL